VKKLVIFIICFHFLHFLSFSPSFHCLSFDVLLLVVFLFFWHSRSSSHVFLILSFLFGILTFLSCFSLSTLSVSSHSCSISFFSLSKGSWIKSISFLILLKTLILLKIFFLFLYFHHFLYFFHHLLY